MYAIAQSQLIISQIQVAMVTDDEHYLNFYVDTRINFSDLTS